MAASKTKKLQIGDKSYQTMDVNIESIKLKDLGMTPGVGTGADMLVGKRFNSSGSFQAGDVRINDQALAAFDGTTQDIGDLVNNINQNVDNVKASAFNTVVAKQIGTGVTTDGQFQIKVKSLGASAATTYSISASNSLTELVANINTQAGGQVTASVNDAGKLVLSNETGATISVSDTTQTTGYETASGFTGGAAAAFTDYSGFLSLESKDGSPIRVERGNLDKTAPGSLADLQVLGFREVTSQFNNAQDAYTVTGDALTAPATEWALGDLKLNGVDIYNANIKTDSFQGKLDAINNFSEQTGVIAYAAMDKTFSFTGTDLLMSSGSVLVINGVSATVTAAASAATMAEITTAINAITSKTGITASFNGLNLKLTGTNVQSMTVGTQAAAGTATALLGFTGTQNTYYGSIRLDSAKNQPISIETATGATAGAIGLLEQNVGASDFDVNAPQLGVASGSSLSGLNIASATSATKAIAVIDHAIESVSSYRSKLGAMENRLNSTVNNLSNIVTNTQASRSRIQDTDYASETTQLAKAQIISQAATAMLAQANQQPQSVLSLLK